MKGNISLKEFIEDVKKELRDSVNDNDPFFIMGDVELEVSFGLDAEAKAGAKLFVLDVGGSTKATQTHKVKLTLSPFVEEKEIEELVESNPTNIKTQIAEQKARVFSNHQVKRAQPTVEVKPLAPGKYRNHSPRRSRPVCHGGKSNRAFIGPNNSSSKKI